MVQRVLGRLEPVDDNTARLVASTSNPTWYAEQLTHIRAPFRILRSPELKHEAHRLGERLLSAAT